VFRGLHPSASLLGELFAAYPNAKFILTTRDPAKWKASTKSTIYRFNHFPFAHLERVVRSPMLKMQFVAERIWRVFFRGRFLEDGEAIFEEHNANVQTLIPAEQLLIYEVKQGWGPLCAFLEVPVPVGDTCEPVER
jgi:hypothetical protein